MKMKFSISILIFLCFYSGASAQNIHKDDSSLIVHNIISYHIRKAVEADAPEILYPTDKPIFQRLMPARATLRVEIDRYKEKMEYPDNDYQLFVVRLPGFNYDIGDSISYSGRLMGFMFDEDYLVGYNFKKASIKYISGNFFKSSIAEDFDLNNSDPRSFYSYLMLRCFNMHPDMISFTKKDDSGMYFKIHSTILDATLDIFVKYDNHETIKVLENGNRMTY